MIGIIDYGLGNIQSFVSIYKKLNIPVTVTSCVEDLESVKKIILPGVGSFDWAMKRLKKSGIYEILESLVLEKKMPILGVCVGMQIMANSSEEGLESGLCWIDAKVKKFKSTDLGCQKPLPHMGWNKVDSNGSSILFKNLDPDMRFYFLHSYYFSPLDETNIVGFSSYGDRFACAFEKDNIYGVQFHPEKSHGCGIQLLKNFAQA